MSTYLVIILAYLVALTVLNFIRSQLGTFFSFGGNFAQFHRNRRIRFGEYIHRRLQNIDYFLPAISKIPWVKLNPYFC